MKTKNEAIFGDCSEELERCSEGILQLWQTQYDSCLAESSPSIGSCGIMIKNCPNKIGQELYSYGSFGLCELAGSFIAIG